MPLKMLISGYNRKIPSYQVNGFDKSSWVKTFVSFVSISTHQPGE